MGFVQALKIYHFVRKHKENNDANFFTSICKAVFLLIFLNFHFHRYFSMTAAVMAGDASYDPGKLWNKDFPFITKI